MNKTLAFVALASILGLVAYVVTGMAVMRAYGETQKERFVIFLGYSDEEVAKWQSLYDRTFTDLPSEFAPMLQGENVQLVAAPSMKDWITAYQYVLPELRATHPDGVFVFVTKNTREFQLVGSMAYGGTSYMWKAEGATLVDKGFAIVLED
jgi:hypothetical protein